MIDYIIGNSLRQKQNKKKTQNYYIISTRNASMNIFKQAVDPLCLRALSLDQDPREFGPSRSASKFATLEPGLFYQRIIGDEMPVRPRLQSFG